MAISVNSYGSKIIAFFEKGLAHPSFLGRLVSWGVLLGTLSFIAKKTFDLAYPKIKSLWMKKIEKVEELKPERIKQVKPQTMQQVPEAQVKIIEKVIETIEKIVCKRCQKEFPPKKENIQKIPALPTLPENPAISNLKIDTQEVSFAPNVIEMPKAEELPTKQRQLVENPPLEAAINFSASLSGGGGEKFGEIPQFKEEPKILNPPVLDDQKEDALKKKSSYWPFT